MTSLKSLLPTPIRNFARTAYRDFAFGRAVQTFLENPSASEQPGSILNSKLIYGWGNEAWSTLDEYLAACVHHALRAQGPILECGSGLTTILVGAIAQRAGQPHWALEHIPAWAAKVQKHLKQHQLDAVHLCVSPLKDYGNFGWYDPPLDTMPANFSLVICDGPPSTTKDGRYGLIPIMKERLAPDCVILLDDAGRDQERAIAERWAKELGASFELLGAEKPYIKMTLSSRKSDAQTMSSSVMELS